MSGFEAYKIYVALKNHFTKEGYDYVKFNGKAKLKQSSFDSRKDKVFFEKLAKHADLENFLIANFIENNRLWIRDLAYSEDAEKRYASWKKRTGSLTYNFKKDLNKIINEPAGNHQHPVALRLYLANEINLESLCILLTITRSIEEWNDKLQYDPIWDDIKLRVLKYTPFIKYDKNKIKEVMYELYRMQAN
jgi:hypothetical protein